MRIRPLLCFFLTVSAPAIMGCATLFAPGPDMVPVRSTPSGAAVYLDDIEAGRTPCIVAVARSSEGRFRFELAGYEPVTIERDKVCNGLTALNLLGGFITMPLFFAIDAMTGNIGKYSTKPIHVELKPAKREPAPDPLPSDIPTLGIRPLWNPRRW